MTKECQAEMLLKTADYYQRISAEVAMKDLQNNLIDMTLCEQGNDVRSLLVTKIIEILGVKKEKISGATSILMDTEYSINSRINIVKSLAN